MEIKQNPFSVYDFLGYLIPGALSMYIIAIGMPFAGFEFPSFLRDANFFCTRPDVYIPFAISAYILGHLLSFLSSIFVERYTIWSFGYPSQFILGRPAKGYYSSLPTGELFVTRCLIRTAFWILNFPFSSLDTFLNRTIKIRELYAKALDKPLITLIRRKIWIFVGVEMGIFRAQGKDKGDRVAGKVSLKDVDYFRAIYHYVIHNIPSHTASLKNYVAMYGFLRTITFLLTVLFWCVATKLGIFYYKWLQSNAEDSILNHKLIVSVVVFFGTWIGAYLFFMAFVKFYRRYTLEALMAFSSNYVTNPPDNCAEPFLSEILVPLEPQDKKEKPD